MTGTVVLVGHGMVGHHFAERLRAGDRGGRWRLVVLAEERLPAYDRVLLSSYLDGKSADDLSLTSHEFRRDPLVSLRLATRVTAIDRAARTVTVADGGPVGYDALVLATGSHPFVPPVPGRDLTGCFVYRTIDDLDAIRAAAAEGRPGVVVGGGLLGLEAANTLRLLGMRVSVVEAAGHLMPAQLDHDGGRVLAGLAGELGLETYCGAPIASIDGGRGRVEGVTLADGTGLAADLVVFSAGIRPRDELAGPAGLARGERGGFLVDDRCRTADPRVLAIGECAAVRGRCYGLVAPGYRTAEVAAGQILGHDEPRFHHADLSTRLKLLGVRVASFGDSHARARGAIELAYRRDGGYAKLVLGPDERTLLGGILVGDTHGYPFLRAHVGRELPASPEQLLFR